MEARSPFAEWSPRDYLDEYYRAVQQDERSTIQYFVEEIREAPHGPTLCFGCGPTLHHVFLAARRATGVYLADYLQQNLDEIDRWRREDARAHDWTAFVRYTLQCESGADPDEGEIAARITLLRQKIAGLVHCDAGRADPMGEKFRGVFATVISPYCADSVTDDKRVWESYSRNIATLVRPGGLFLISALRHCRGYKIAERTFPSADIDEGELQAVLARDFLPETIRVGVREVPEHEAQGFSSILLARAQKPSDRSST